MKNIVIIGYGQLGQTVAKRHLSQNDRVTTVSRSNIPSIDSRHQHISSDLDQLTSPLELPDVIDCLYYFAPPSNHSLHDDRLNCFIQLHTSINLNHIIYISTTGVYGNSNGEWIDEKTEAKPAADRAKRRLDAESQLITFAKQTNTALTILRCAAIYSSQSVNINKLRANKKPVIRKEQAPYTNRIHLEDLTEICILAMLKKPEVFDIYNVSDGQPTTTTEHAWLLADLAGIERAMEIDKSEADKYYSTAYLSYLNESKRIDISKLITQLSPAFKYKNTADGVRQCLTALD